MKKMTMVILAFLLMIVAGCGNAGGKEESGTGAQAVPRSYEAAQQERQKITWRATPASVNANTSREEVDEMVRKAVEAGGTAFCESEGQGWMYGAGFADLDGHRWNVLYMDMSQMPKE